MIPSNFDNRFVIRYICTVGSLDVLSIMNNKLILAVSFLSILLLLSCEEDKGTEPVEPEDYVYGYAYLDSADSHEGILVRMVQSGDSSYTDATGRFEFPLQQPDTYTVVANCEGYAPDWNKVYIAAYHHCSVPDLNLEPLDCISSDDLPEDYPLGVSFKEDDSFGGAAQFYYIDDTLYVVGFEYFQPPSLEGAAGDHAHDFDLVVISSLGDVEKTPIYMVLGGIPERWRYGYVIGTKASYIPHPYDGVVEVEPTGGWVTGMYNSYWVEGYFCRSIEMRAVQSTPVGRRTEGWKK